MMLLSLETMESLQNGVATDFEETPLFSMRAVLLASLQSCRSVDADIWCKRALMHSALVLALLALWINSPELKGLPRIKSYLMYIWDSSSYFS